MWKQIKLNMVDFLSFWQRIPFPRKLVAISYMLLVVLYPGQNYFQTLIIHPGPVRSYQIPVRPTIVYPVHDGVVVPFLTARSTVIQDVDSKTMILANNPDQQLMPASTTKIMTALVALDYYDLNQHVVVQNEDRAVGSTMELVKGEELTIESLLYGLLVDSGNDAALALAENYCNPAKSRDEKGACGYDSFVTAMNAKAREYHLDHTHYKNVSGVESYGHTTTARDLAILAAEAVKNPVINRIMQTKTVTVSDISGKIVHELVSTNELLGVVPGLKGLKTGWTENAGECLVSYVERDGRRVVIVVLGSRDRFGETKNLVEWVYAHHTWQIIE